jgi:hypothetical protein
MNVLGQIGCIFAVIGTLFVLPIMIAWIHTKMQCSKHGILTKARIVEIRDIYKPSATEMIITHEVYVCYEVNGEIVESKLNYYDGNFQVGQILGVYYFDNDPLRVVALAENKLFKIAIGLGLLNIIIGIVMVFTGCN